MTATTEQRRTGIITPEAVVLEFETAGVASRLLARVIDAIALWIVLFVVALVVTTAFVGSETTGIILIVFLLFFLILGYWMLLETLWQGRTLGKAAMGLRVVTTEGAPVTFRHSAIRAIVGLVDFFLPPLGPVAVVSVLVSPSDQRLGDLAAGTIVLRERSAGGPATALALTEPPGREPLMAALQLARLSEGQYSVVRRFLLRAHSLTPESRARLAREIAESVERATGVAAPAGLGHEWYLHAAGLAHQRRNAETPALSWAKTQPPPPVGKPAQVSAPPPPQAPPPPVAGRPGPPPPLR